MPNSSQHPQGLVHHGGSSGIGRELARQALDVGQAVAVLARGSVTLDGYDDSGQLLKLTAEVRDEAAVRDAAERAATRFGRIDVAVNNVGHGLSGAVEQVPDAQARDLFDTNVFGA